MQTPSRRTPHLRGASRSAKKVGVGQMRCHSESGDLTSGRFPDRGMRYSSLGNNNNAWHTLIDPASNSATAHLILRLGLHREEHVRRIHTFTEDGRQGPYVRSDQLLNCGNAADRTAHNGGDDGASERTRGKSVAMRPLAHRIPQMPRKPDFFQSSASPLRTSGPNVDPNRADGLGDRER